MGKNSSLELCCLFKMEDVSGFLPKRFTPQRKSLFSTNLFNDTSVKRTTIP